MDYSYRTFVRSRVSTEPGQGHIAHTTRYTNLAADRFKTFWRD